jgi:hypothetical protein
VISGSLKRLGSFLTRHEQAPALFDVPSGRDLFFLTMTGGENCYKEPRSTSAAINEIHIKNLI